MARHKLTPIYLAIGGHVVAVHSTSGEEIWRTKLKSSASYITICVIDGTLYAGAGGELFCLNAGSGEILWNNKLKGLGHGLIAFAGSELAASAAAMQAAQVATTAAIVAATA